MTGLLQTVTAMTKGPLARRGYRHDSTYIERQLRYQLDRIRPDLLGRVDAAERIAGCILCAHDILDVDPVHVQPVNDLEEEDDLELEPSDDYVEAIADPADERWAAHYGEIQEDYYDGIYACSGCGTRVDADAIQCSGCDWMIRVAV